jgi:hypothetical protein
VDTTSGALVGPSFSQSVNPMLSLAWNSDDGSQLFGGSGNTNNQGASWSTSDGTLQWHYHFGGDGQATGYTGGEVYFGFHDNFQGNTTTKLIAVNASNGALDPNFRPVFNQFRGVRAISATSAGLVIGGQFTTVDGVYAHNWARWPSS